MLPSDPETGKSETQILIDETTNKNIYCKFGQGR